MALPISKGGFVAGALGLVGVGGQAGWFAGAAELVAGDADGIDLGCGVDARAVGIGVVGVGAGAAHLNFEVLPEIDHGTESPGFAAAFGGALRQGGGFGFVGEVGDFLAFARHAGAEGGVDDGRA